MTSVCYVDFSPDRLRGHRHGQRRTTAQLADLAGLPTDAIAQFEGAYLKPTALQIVAMASALDVGQDELLKHRANPAADYCHAVLTYARALTPDEIEVAADTIRKIRSKT